MEVVRKRQSIRRYRADPVPEKVLNQIVEAARLAPSAGHRQPWHFILVKDVEIKKQLGVPYWVADAPVIIVGCVDTETRSPPLCYVDLAIAFEHMVLAAANFGLGTCWIGRLARDEPIKTILGIPEHVRVVAVTPIDFPDETPSPKTRKALTDIIHYDKY